MSRAPRRASGAKRCAVQYIIGLRTDLLTLGAIALLIGWAAGTWLLEPPGWFHFLLTLGVFGLIWRIVDRDAPKR